MTFPHKAVSLTGGTGTVAAQLLRVLVNQCPGVEKVITTCRNPQGKRTRRIPDSTRIEVVPGSVLDLPVLERLAAEGDVFYHLAAWLANTAMPERFDEIYLINSLSAAVAARLCRRFGKRMVFASSHSVYFAGPYEGRIQEDAFPFRQDFLNWIGEVLDPYNELADRLIEKGSYEGALEKVLAIHEEFPPPFDPLIYGKDEYHIYCITKLLAERFALDAGGVVLRLSNVYGPGDDSPQAVGEACQRILQATPGERLTIRQPFKKLVPAYLGDIVKSLLAAGSRELPRDAEPVFTVASQEQYFREDALLRTVASALNRIEGKSRQYDIEELPAEDRQAFTYDLTKLRATLLPGEDLTRFEDGLAEQLRWLKLEPEERWGVTEGLRI